LSIAAVVDQVGGVGLPDPVVLAPGLRTALTQVIDPRKRRGVRHPLVVVLTAAVCAVAAGARSFVAAAEWVADLPVEVAVALGVADRCPSESTIRSFHDRDAPRETTVTDLLAATATTAASSTPPDELVNSASTSPSRRSPINGASSSPRTPGSCARVTDAPPAGRCAKLFRLVMVGFGGWGDPGG